MRQLGNLRRGPYSVRVYVSAIVAFIAVPALMVVGWLATSWAASERAQLAQEAEHKTREILADIDREIIAMTSMLTALATSHSLHVGDFGAFHRKAVEVARQLNYQILLRDPQLDEQIVSTLVPWGGPPRRGGLTDERREAERVRPANSSCLSERAMITLLRSRTVTIRCGPSSRLWRCWPRSRSSV